MNYKILNTSVAVFLMLTTGTGCSSVNKVIYHHDIYQGNYVTSDDISKIHLGMTQQQVSYILGSPIMTDPFGSNTWFYFFQQESSHKNIKQETLTLIFNNVGVLINIDINPL